MRRVLLVNALIFAVLAAAVALAYYGYSYTSESRERELQLMHDIAEEKVLNFESLIARDDRTLFDGLEIEKVGDGSYVRELVRSSGAAVASVLVLDDQLHLVPGGSWSSRDVKEAVAIRDWFLTNVIPKLPLATQKLGERGHVYGRRDGKPYVLSYTRRVSGDRTFYVVLDADINDFVALLFPQFFSVSNKRIYEIIDERGELVYGYDFARDPDGLEVEVPFIDTADGWYLRVADRDLGAQAEQRRRHAINSVLIGGAVTVILAGLAFLAYAIRRERKSNELKSEFISNVSHELKTPLSIISMFGEMLANGRTKNADQATEYAEIIWRESVRLGRLIDNVLDFAKIERGMGVYEFAETDVGEVVARAVDLSQRRLAAAEMTLEAKIAPGLPLAQLDANAFTLAVLNLIDNAIKYATDGKRIELSLARDGDRLVLAVHDFGPGIAVEEQEQIFDRFYRARAVRLQPIRGSGIGLALVRHIARAHHGDVEVTSEPGKGATFSIWLPI